MITEKTKDAINRMLSIFKSKDLEVRNLTEENLKLKQEIITLQTEILQLYEVINSKRFIVKEEHEQFKQFKSSEIICRLDIGDITHD